MYVCRSAMKISMCKNLSMELICATLIGLICKQIGTPLTWTKDRNSGFRPKFCTTLYFTEIPTYSDKQRKILTSTKNWWCRISVFFSKNICTHFMKQISFSSYYVESIVLNIESILLLINVLSINRQRFFVSGYLISKTNTQSCIFIGKHEDIFILLKKRTTSA